MAWSASAMETCWEGPITLPSCISTLAAATHNAKSIEYGLLSLDSAHGSPAVR
jgi:hypothetical protein